MTLSTSAQNDMFFSMLEEIADGRQECAEVFVHQTFHYRPSFLQPSNPGWECHLQFQTYRLGGVHVSLVSPDGEPITTLSTHITGAPRSSADSFYLKDWSENEGALEFLTSHNIAQPTGKEAIAGACISVEMQLCPPSRWRPKGDWHSGQTPAQPAPSPSSSQTWHTIHERIDDLIAELEAAREEIEDGFPEGEDFTSLVDDLELQSGTIQSIVSDARGLLLEEKTQ